MDDLQKGGGLNDGFDDIGLTDCDGSHFSEKEFELQGHDISHKAERGEELYARTELGVRIREALTSPNSEATEHLR